LARTTKLPRAFPHPIIPTERKIFVLLISSHPAAIESIQKVLSRRPEDFRLQCVQTVETATARVAGGGVDLLLLDLSERSGPPERRLDPLLDLRQACPTVPVIILCQPGDESLAAEAQRIGAADQLLIEQANARLAGLIDTVVANSRTPISSPTTASRGEGKTITFMGAKGGVGTTVAALNVASALSRKSTVILVELRPAQGVLCRYFHPHPPLKTTANLLTLQTDSLSAAGSAGLSVGPGEHAGAAHLICP
jgi:DNA-binding NarL/FixJ family response regulator